MDPRRFFRLLWRVTAWLIILAGFISVASILYWINSDPRLRRERLTRNATFFCRIMNRVVGLRFRVKNKPDLSEGYLIVANHVGLLDPFVMCDLFSAVFVTSVEMRESLGVGYIAKVAGCFFVERRNRANMKNEIEQLRQVLHDGFSIGLYPEGTSTNGEAVLPFRKSLLTSVVGTGRPILPMVINYVEIEGEPMSWKWRDYICWYGDHPLLGYALRLLSVKSIVVDVEFLEPIACESDEDRRHVAEKAHAEISKRFIKIPLGPGEKSTFTLPKSLRDLSQSRSPGA